MMTPDELASADLRVAAVVREVAQLGGDDDHVAELLDRVVRQIRLCVDGADHCGITIAFGDMTFTAAASAPEVGPINDEQFTFERGTVPPRRSHRGGGDCGLFRDGRTLARIR